jgi:hypothetical protein
MYIKTGNMFDYNCDLLCVTTNSFIKKNGALVMGRGAAKQLKDSFPGIEYEFGKNIKHLSNYGLCVVEYKGYLFGAFQTKNHFKNKSNVFLIAMGVNLLNKFISDNEYIRCVSLNYPGIGYGNLKEKDVYKIIQYLNNKVIVWKN